MKNGKKLIIQIPCFNEEDSLPITLAAIPKTIPGIDTIEIMVINDGSTDATVSVAKRLGVRHILDFEANRGLAHAFSAGLIHAAKSGADYLVNLDADNQYNADDIPKLLAPLMDGGADMVVGERPIRDIEHFSPLKKKLQALGSLFVRKLAGVKVMDTPSGFRALNRRAMLGLFIFNRFTYTHESLIAANEADLRVAGVPIRVNEGVLRPSRLMKNAFQYLVRSGVTALRFYMIYNPYPIFMTLSAVTGLLGVALAGRFAWFYLTGHGQGWIQSLIIAGILITISLFSLSVGILTDILRVNRKLMQRMITEMRENIYSAKIDSESASDKES